MIIVWDQNAERSEAGTILRTVANFKCLGAKIMKIYINLFSEYLNFQISLCERNDWNIQNYRPNFVYARVKFVLPPWGKEIDGHCLRVC